MTWRYDEASSNLHSLAVKLTDILRSVSTHATCAAVPLQDEGSQASGNGGIGHSVHFEARPIELQDVLFKNTAEDPFLLELAEMASADRARQSRNIIGGRLKEARRQATPPLTQDQLAGRLALEGVQLDRVAISKIESGLRCAFDYEVKSCAKVLGVDVAWLLGISPRHKDKSK